MRSVTPKPVRWWNCSGWKRKMKDHFCNIIIPQDSIPLLSSHQTAPLILHKIMTKVKTKLIRGDQGKWTKKASCLFPHFQRSSRFFFLRIRIGDNDSIHYAVQSVCTFWVGKWNSFGFDLHRQWKWGVGGGGRGWVQKAYCDILPVSYSGDIQGLVKVMKVNCNFILGDWYKWPAYWSKTFVRRNLRKCHCWSCCWHIAGSRSRCQSKSFLHCQTYR